MTCEILTYARIQNLVVSKVLRNDESAHNEIDENSNKVINNDLVIEAIQVVQ